MTTWTRFTFGLALACSAQLGIAQAGTWLLDGWPDTRHEYFAGRTEIYADGDRLKITEWPENTEEDAESLETYFLGQTVVKVFPWNGERVGLVFEASKPLPRAEQNSEGKLVLPPPFPPLPSQESKVPCGEDCVYHVRVVAFEEIDPALFAPGGMLDNTFQPAPDIPLMSKAEFMDRHRISPPVLTPFGVSDEP
mgnify:CR=1 FL=1